MNKDRRAFFRFAAAAPVAIATAAITPPVGGSNAAAAPVATPYTDYKWQWGVTDDNETFHAMFDTFDEAYSFAQSAGYEFIAECLPQDFSLRIHGDDVVDWLNDNNEESIGEDGGIVCTDAQAQDLGAMVTAAIEAWAVKHQIDIRAWCFAATRNATKVIAQPIAQKL